MRIECHLMFNRKLFRISILALVSLGAVLFSILFFWKIDGESPNLKAHLISSLKYGIPAGLTLDALAWFGAGLDHWLARIQNTTRRSITSLGVYFILPGAMCVCLPAMLILAADALSTASSPSTGGEQHFVGGFLTILTLLPALFGWTSIYVGAGASALSRWLAARIWREG